ncbi:MAG: argininosuccinate lyase [Elusimicrobia bacterium]|nr:argininosuccinate lyase [Elusimicrobiota bacterium]
MKNRPVSPSDFVASFGFDHRLAPHDLVASMAHVEMLGRRRILSRGEASKIIAGLKKLLARVNAGGRLLKTEDVHFSIEKSLYAEIGPLAGKMHTARSRNDQTVTALRMYLRERVDGLRERLRTLELTFVDQAEKNVETIMPGYTHLQPGQPISAAQHFLAYAWMFRRDRERLADVRRRINRLPLGAAALAGTTFPIDRAWVARKLDFDGVMENSIDAVSDRDFLVEFLAAGALVMTHLSRWAEELIVWSNPSFGFVTLADPFITGSSIMPQKRNPDMAELLRGKTGRVLGSLTALLTLIKGTPLAYNRDLQEDKPPVFDAVDTLEACLDVSIPMAQTLKLHPDRTKAACRLGFLLATDVADALARRGLPFREAHALVGRVVTDCLKTNRTLEDLTLDDWKKFSPLFGNWVTSVLSVEDAVAARRSLGGTAPGEVRRQIALLRKKS